MTNTIKISAAGSGKTYDICREALSKVADGLHKVLIVTYTNRGEKAVETEIRKQNMGVLHPRVIIKTWYRFLLSDTIKPYQSYLTGDGSFNVIKNIDYSKTYGTINFHKKGTKERYLIGAGNVLSNQASELACFLDYKSDGKIIDRLSEIYSNIYLLGHQLSSPLTVGDLGDDFDFTDTWGSEFSFEEWFCVADYKGKNLNVCSFVLENCSGPEDIKDSTKINEIYVDSDDKADYDEPVISVYGITIGDTRDDVCQKIGAPSRTLETSLSLTDDYRGDYGETLVSFEYSEPDFTQIEQITVYLR